MSAAIIGRSIKSELVRIGNEKNRFIVLFLNKCKNKNNNNNTIRIPEIRWLDSVQSFCSSPQTL